MRNALEEFLIRHIAAHGPMDVGRFMQIALTHPQYGYYMTRDPFGRSGDFITAPEISQMFGEMIGVWAADIWNQMGAPAEFLLVECGPGRGTLMADILRATKHISGFHAAAKVHLIEVSPALKAVQKTVLGSYDVCWCDDVSALPSAAPIILIANEFLDALAFRQLQKSDGQWFERVVTFDGQFGFALAPVALQILQKIPQRLLQEKDGAVYEFSPLRESFVAGLAQKIFAQNGAALLIDYGHITRSIGDTFQALKDNQYIDVFAAIGESDLTSHVDFEALGVVARQEGLHVHDPAEQGAFLQALGIAARADALQEKASADQALGIKYSLRRLTDSSEMGSLFKVMCMSKYNDKNLKPAGF
jgi:NADH dehydrogenase [ubiquinone] 1 alpha subcomplex assembly factor 7